MSEGSRLVQPTMEEVLLLAHPRHMESARLYGYGLKTNYPAANVRIEPTVEGGWEPNAAAVLKHIGDRGEVAVGIFGGDGTNRDLGEAALRVPELADRIALASIDKGYGRDIRAGQRGSRRRVSVHAFMGSAPVRSFGLQCSYEDDSLEAEQRLIAVSHMGIGKTATATLRINNRDDDNDPGFVDTVVQDTGTVLSTLRSQEAFEVIAPALGIAGNDKPQHAILGDLTLGKGSRIAKRGHLPIRHWEEAFFVLSTVEGRLATAVASLRLAFGRPKGKTRQKPIEIVLPEAKPIHLDGDIPRDRDGNIRTLPRMTLIRLGLAEGSYTMLVAPRRLRSRGRGKE